MKPKKTLPRVLTQHNNNGRTGLNPSEVQLSTDNVNVNTFGKLFSHSVIGEVYAQPLYVPRVAIKGKGTHDTVFIATMENWIYAFDANNNAKDNSQALWAHQVDNRPAVPSKIFGQRYTDIPGGGKIGILSTPVIDAKIDESAGRGTTGKMYVILFTYDEGKIETDPMAAFHHFLYAIDIADGLPLKEPSKIEGSVSGKGYAGGLEIDAPVDVSSDGNVTVDGSLNHKGHVRKLQILDTEAGKVTFCSMQQLQRPGLLLHERKVYCGFGSHADSDPYHGWVFAYDAESLEQKGIFCSTPNGAKGGIWQAGEGLVVDEEAFIHLGSGNGDFKAYGSATGPDLGECFIKLDTKQGKLALRGYLRAFDDFLSPAGTDNDLGASSPTLLPDGRLVGGGKDGNFYLLDSKKMDVSGSKDALIQQFIASFGPGTRDPVGTKLFHHIHGSPVAWESPEHGPLVYVWGENDVARVYRYTKLREGDSNAGRFPDQGRQGQPFALGSIFASIDVEKGMPGGMLSISAEDSGQHAKPGSGILWASIAPYGDANKGLVQGALVAFNASQFNEQSRLVDIWSSLQYPDRDDCGLLSKFCCPTIANGKVYLATFSNQFCVYGLLPKGKANGGYNVGFGGSNGLTFNGNASVAPPTRNRGGLHGIRLSGLHRHQVSSIFITRQVNVSGFETRFIFRLDDGTDTEAISTTGGFTFTVQSEDSRALGSPGSGLGYGINPNDTDIPPFFISRSVAIKFQLVEDDVGKMWSATGIYFHGQPPTTEREIRLDPFGINLRTKHKFLVTVRYHDAVVVCRIKDLTSSRNEDTEFRYPVNIPAFVGRKAYVGFTAGTGATPLQQEIFEWRFKSSK